MANYVMPIENISPSLRNVCNQPTCMFYVCSVFSTKQNDNFYKHFFESCKGNAFTQTYCYGTVQDTELVNLSISNAFLHNLMSVISCLVIWKYIHAISHKITI